MTTLMLTPENDFMPLNVLRRKYKIITYPDCWVAVSTDGTWVGLHIIQ